MVRNYFEFMLAIIRNAAILLIKRYATRNH